MLDRKRSAFDWIDMVFVLFVASASRFLPPIDEVHKQLTLLAIIVFQLIEGRLGSLADRAEDADYSVLIKIALATLLLDHTQEVGINSTYYPIYYLPVVTAAMYFGPIGTLLWTALAPSLAYCSFLWPALQEYRTHSRGSVGSLQRASSSSLSPPCW